MKTPHCKQLVLPILLVAGAASHAETLPRDLNTDSRIKTVVYKENDVVTVSASPFIGTIIHFLPDEQIMQPIAMGDPAAWDVQMLSPRDLIISPIASNPDTNMTVRTDKRFHFFYLTQNDSTKHKDATFSLQITDPILTERQRRAAGNQSAWQPPQPNSAPAADAPSANVEIDHLYNTAETEMWHFKYKITGSKHIHLDQVFDNGVKTFFSFKPDSPIPVIFVVRDDQESLVQTVPATDGYLVAMTVANRWILRRDKYTKKVTRTR